MAETTLSPGSRSDLGHVLEELAPHGVLRAGINLSNPLLVTGTSASGKPTGVAPDLAAHMAAGLGIDCDLVGYAAPADVAYATATGSCGVGLIGADPARADSVAFTSPYAEIEATYLVAQDSPIVTADEVDRPEIRVVAMRGTAFTLWLQRNLQHAELVMTDTLEAATDAFLGGGFDVIANLRPALLRDAAARPGFRLLDGRFMTVQQAVGTARANSAALPFLSAFVARAVSSGLVAELIERHGVLGLQVAPVQGHPN